MYPFIEIVDNQGSTHYRSIAIVFFGLVVIGIRVRVNHAGGDVALIVLHIAAGIGWGG